MSVSKLLITRQILFSFCLVAFLVSCNPDEEATTPEKKPARATGWVSESDNAGSVPENISNPYDSIPDDQLPKKIDLSNFLPPVGNQGEYGTCVAWATAYNLKTALEAIKFNFSSSQLQEPANQLSPKYLFTALSSSEKGADCNGTAFTNALNLLLKKGVATKQTVPYTNLGNCSESNIDPQWDEEAKKHKIKNYRRIDPEVVVIKRALANNMPVVVGCKLDDSFMQWNSDAVYQFSGPNTEVGIHSYHAMCIVGYDNDKGPAGAFKVVNSWSDQWGTKGFIWVDYNFLVNGFVFGDNGKNLYVAVNDEQKPNITDPVTISGKNLTAWVFEDVSNEENNRPTQRKLKYNIYNQGSESINTDSRWGYCIFYINATNGEDYDILSYSEFDPNAPSRFYLEQNPNPKFSGLKMNVNIPSGSNLAYEMKANFTSPDEPGKFDFIEIDYWMPKNLNGNYYTVLYADVTEKFEETDEEDNFFFFPEQEPKTYSNGVGARKNVLIDSYQNNMGISKMNSHEAKRFHTMVSNKNRNAYTPQEIICMLKKEKRNGNLDRKINAFKNSKSANKLLVGSNK